MRSPNVPLEAFSFMTRLKPCENLSGRSGVEERKKFLEKHIKSLKQRGISLGISRWREEAYAPGGGGSSWRSGNGVPKGLVPVPAVW